MKRVEMLVVKWPTSNQPDPGGKEQKRSKQLCPTEAYWVSNLTLLYSQDLVCRGRTCRAATNLSASPCPPASAACAYSHSGLRLLIDKVLWASLLLWLTAWERVLWWYKGCSFYLAFAWCLRHPTKPSARCCCYMVLATIRFRCYLPGPARCSWPWDRIPWAFLSTATGKMLDSLELAAHLLPSSVALYVDAFFLMKMTRLDACLGKIICLSSAVPLFSWICTVLSLASCCGRRITACGRNSVCLLDEQSASQIWATILQFVGRRPWCTRLNWQKWIKVAK